MESFDIHNMVQILRGTGSAKTLALIASLAVLAGYIVPKVVAYTRQDVRKLNGPPSSDANFWFGHELALWEGEVSEKYTEWANKYGSFFKIKAALGQSDIIIATDHEAVRHVLADTRAYVRSPYTLPLVENVLGRGIVWAQGTDHANQRRLLSPFFSTESVQRFDETFVECAERLKDQLFNAIQANGGHTEVNIMEYISVCTLDIIGRVGFDYDFKGGSSSEAQTIVREWHRTVNVGLGKSAFIANVILRSIPVLAYIPNKAAHDMSEIKRLTIKIAQRIYEEKVATLQFDIQGQEKNKFSQGKDLLSVLVYSKFNDKGNLTKEQILANIASLIMVGHETTGVTVDFILYSLGRNQTMQNKLREEIFNSGQLSYSTVNKMIYLDAIVKEGLRLYPAAPHTDRVALKDDIIPLTEPIKASNGEILRSIRIRRGQIIKIPLQTMNTRQPVWGPDSEVFRPERWIEPGGIPPHNQLPHGWSSTLSFLDGPRNCLGWRLALLEIKIIIATLIRSFEFYDINPKISLKVPTTLQPVFNGEAGILPLGVKLFHA